MKKEEKAAKSALRSEVLLFPIRSDLEKLGESIKDYIQSCHVWIDDVTIDKSILDAQFLFLLKFMLGVLKGNKSHETFRKWISTKNTLLAFLSDRYKVKEILSYFPCLLIIGSILALFSCKRHSDAVPKPCKIVAQYDTIYGAANGGGSTMGTLSYHHHLVFLQCSGAGVDTNIEDESIRRQTHSQLYMVGRRHYFGERQRWQ